MNTNPLRMRPRQENFEMLGEIAGIKKNGGPIGVTVG
jgi:hypothetical protein